MIKRTREGSNVPSLVNTAQNEHFNAAEGIRSDVPVTNLTSVSKSINFVTNADGSCSLRHPLILKEYFANNKWYLYDKVHILEIKATGDETVPQFKYYIKDSETLVPAELKLKYLDFNNKEHILELDNNERELSFLKFLNIYNTADTTFLFVEFTRKQVIDGTVEENYNGFVNYIRKYNTTHSTTESENIYLEDLNYDKISSTTYNEEDITLYKTYRLLKIYKDLDDLEHNTWIIEIVSAELNSFTSSFGEEGLDINLLLDNPYATRDLYKYGYMSTTKILPYLAIGYNALDIDTINALHVYDLTEGLINKTTGKGFKIITSTNTVDLFGKVLVLKAFLTTEVTNTAYYCVWEESDNGGIDWHPCQAFLDKFADSTVEKTVIDLTVEDFEKNLKEDINLDVEATYTVTKEMVRLNPAETTVVDISSQASVLSKRPDVLVLTSMGTNPLKKYRFQIYVETNKTYGDSQVSTYLSSTTGEFSLPYSDVSEYAKDLSKEHNNLFTGVMYDSDNHLFIYNKYGLYVSSSNSLTFPLMKSITSPTEIVNIIAWRSYLLIFTEKDITLAIYDISTDTYNYKILSNSLGVPKEDAKTIACVLNSIYFKSENKILRLTPNLYASKDDILNIYPVSEKINTLLENLLSKEIESNNFSYTTAEYYYVFIPLKESESQKTYVLRYDLSKKIWNLFEYPILVTKVESLGTFDEYLKSDLGIYYFNDSLEAILSKTYVYEYVDIVYVDETEDPEVAYNLWFTDGYLDYEISILSAVRQPIKNLLIDFPYTDILYTPILDVYNAIANTNSFKGYIDKDNSLYLDTTPTGLDSTDIELTPIHFMLDFGQKSSNYTVFKSFLETKITLATLSAFDYFPFTLTVSVDGMYQNNLHLDINTDSAIWKNSFSQKGTLGTNIYDNNTDYDGIVRQLIVKYSSKGKTIRHILEGYSKTNFKFYSMDVRSRILPKKQ